MGTRHLQRLQAELLPEHESSSASGSDDEHSPVVTRPAMFALLEEDETDEASESETFSTRSAPTPAQPVKANRSSQQGTSSAAHRDISSSKPITSAGATQNEDIDAILADLDRESEKESNVQSERVARESMAAPSALSGLLAVNKKHLDAGEEMRNILGTSEALLERQLLREEGEQRVRPGGQRRGRVRRAAAVGPRAPLLLCQSREANERPFDGSLDHEKTRNLEDGSAEFVYRGVGATHRAAASEFALAQASHNPNNVIAVLNQFPFHVEALLAMCDFYQATDQGDYAGAMLERALFALESAWHPQFKSLMLNGKARLPVAQGKNALFFRTTYQKMRLLIRRGCPRTALEWGKMILSLDPEDPCGILFQMDYCALRSRQFEFVHYMMTGITGALHLPNFAFSEALADYHMCRAKQGSASAARGMQGVKQDFASSLHRQAMDRSKVDVKLVNAILMYPTVLSELVDAMREKGAASSARWNAATSRLFQPKTMHGVNSATLTHLARIFASRHVELWKASDVQGWLLRCVECAADAAEGATANGTSEPSAKEGSEPMHEIQMSYSDARALTECNYPASKENAFAFVDVMHFSDARPQLDPAQIAGIWHEGRPAARVGDDWQDAAHLMQIVDEISARAQREQGVLDEELHRAHPIVALLRTMLPWVNLQRDPGQRLPEGQPAIPQRLWGVALANFPGLSEHLDARGLHAEREPRSDEERREIEQAMAAWLMQNM